MVRYLRRQEEAKVVKSTKDNPKALWRFVKTKSNPKTSLPDIKHQGTVTSSYSEKAETFSKFGLMLPLRYQIFL